PQIDFSALAMLSFLYVLYGTYDLPFLDRIFPVAVAVVGVLSSALILVPQLRAQKTGGESSVNFDADAHAEDGGPWRFVAWLVAFLALIGLVGCFLALLIFFLAFLRSGAKGGWAQSVTLTMGAALMITVPAWFLNMQMPPGLLQDHFYA